jgi:dipeptide transport system substrate-binding protein
MRRFVWIAVTGGLLALAAVSAGPAAAQTLVFCSEGSPESLNPQVSTTTTGINAGRPLFNNLVEFPPGSTEIAPGLAESWAISPDGTEYIFHLREGVPFHSNDDFTPTRPLNADDVIFSIERQWKEDHPYHGVGGGSYSYFRDMGMPDLLQSVVKVDEHTVRIRLNRPEAPFLADLAMPFNVVQSAEYAAKLLEEGRAADFDTHPIGTGPFVFDGFQPDVVVRYRAFPEYWAGVQPIDRLIFSINPNAAVRLTRLRAGECHVAAFPSPDDAAEIEADPDLALLRQEGLNVGYVAMNTMRPPFHDPLVRRAIAMAIDKAAIIEAVYRGAGVVAKNPIPPTMWSYDDAIEDYPYDPAAAQALLIQAGLAEGFDTELWYLPVNRPYNPNGRRVAEMIQTDLARVGIHATLMTEDWPDYVARLQNGEFPMALYGWTGDNGDPDNFLHVLLGCLAARSGGNNIARWCDPEYDRLVTEAKLTSDRAIREGLYRQAQAIFHAEMPWVPIAHSVVLMATRSNVTGFTMDPLGRHAFEGVDLAED